MEKEQIVTKLTEVIHDVLPELDEVDMHANMVNEYGVNSVSLIRLLVAAESKFDISFTDYDLAPSNNDPFSTFEAVLRKNLHWMGRNIKRQEMKNLQ